MTVTKHLTHMLGPGIPITGWVSFFPSQGGKSDQGAKWDLTQSAPRLVLEIVCIAIVHKLDCCLHTIFIN